MFVRADAGQTGGIRGVKNAAAGRLSRTWGIGLGTVPAAYYWPLHLVCAPSART